jgi:hypothetical protein
MDANLIREMHDWRVRMGAERVRNMDRQQLEALGAEGRGLIERLTSFDELKQNPFKTLSLRHFLPINGIPMLDCNRLVQIMVTMARTPGDCNWLFENWGKYFRQVVGPVYANWFNSVVTHKLNELTEREATSNNESKDTGELNADYGNTDTATRVVVAPRTVTRVGVGIGFGFGFGHPFFGPFGYGGFGMPFFGPGIGIGIGGIFGGGHHFDCDDHGFDCDSDCGSDC